ncbi:MAG: hypothetical protein RL240_1483 [Planctomycetota bacterium]
MQNQREFTESWLQALTLSADHSHARSIRPWLTTIQTLAASAPNAEQAQEAEKLWEYASGHGLLSLITCLPARSTPWRFEDDECYKFSPVDSSSNQTPNGDAVGTTDGSAITKERWLTELGISPVRFSGVAHVTAADWSNAIRKEAVKRGKPLNVTSIPAGNMLDLPCTLEWDLHQWKVSFTQPSWMQLTYESPFQADRTSMERLTEYLMDALGVGQEKFKPMQKLSAFEPESAPWTLCIPDFSEWHREVLFSQSIGLSPWMRRTWNCVWPVIMRERNRLRGPCDLQYLRTELKACFDSEPAMVQWMFILARLACEVRLGTGLGLCGDFH